MGYRQNSVDMKYKDKTAYYNMYYLLRFRCVYLFTSYLQCKMEIQKLYVPCSYSNDCLIFQAFYIVFSKNRVKNIYISYQPII